MVGVNIGDTLTSTPWAPEKIEQALAHARSSGYFSCDAVKFWHCDSSRVLPTAQQDHIRKVMVHANNHEMLSVSDWRAWVETHLSPVVGGLRGQRVHKEIFLAVGNEALAPWHVEMFGRRLVPCMKEVYAALQQTGLSDRVKLVTPLEMSILGASYPPSAGQVAEAHLEVVSEVVRLLVRIGSPFCINVYPFFAREHSSRDFVLFGPDEGYTDGEGGRLRYTNMFDAQFDAVVTGISKLKDCIVGADQLEMVVTEVGWPTAGSDMADKESARRFTAGATLVSTKGTPLRPGRLDVYLFELYDECQKDGAAHEKHFGLFDIGGCPK
ncbi:unnamed protein product [Ectocarpus sp. 4 AP-2014]